MILNRNSAWFHADDFPENLYRRWELGFYYIVQQGIAPMLVGEFGGHQVGTNSTEGIWAQQFVEFINQKKLGFAYWCWNPNSPDTGGFVKSDWKTVVGVRRRDPRSADRPLAWGNRT